jgi:hypothetical protein
MVAAERRGSHTRNCPDFGWCRPAVRGRLTNYPAPQAVLRHLALLFGLPRPRLEGNMAQGLIADQDTGINVAIMRGGEVFRDDREGARIAIVLNDYLYDLNGVLVGHLNGRHVIDVNTQCMPIGFRKLLEGKS